ncbi:alkylated DNA repair protein alkB homolog 8 isoform X2 [Cephus cinctus]|nr:alkylated DNA repair protein alkB homolog 8 isoform X2 [Cephus cinctus]
MVCNAGLVTGFKRETLEDIVADILPVCKLSECSFVMPPGKSYCFLDMATTQNSKIVYEKVHGCMKLPGKTTPFYLSYVESVPTIEDDYMNAALPPGLKLIEEFVSEEEEASLLNSLNWNHNDKTSSELKLRQVQHFGFEFQYNTNLVDPEQPIEAIPKSYNYLQKRFEEHNCGHYKYDQLTVNKYMPGQGIPTHIDTHSPFEDTILSLSLGSACVMNFKNGDKKTTVFLPPRSLLIMSGEARYVWSHGICRRHNDVIKTENGITIRPRTTRTSFTFRKVRRGDCQCVFPEFCDSKRKNGAQKINENIAPSLEECYVHQVYEEISDHFSETRHKQWPNVSKFLDTIEKGGLLLDVGCGNGKYLAGRPDIIKVGCDRSNCLLEVCRMRSFEVYLSDCLYLPCKDNLVDAALSIAVIHHLSTESRRKRAIEELVRILRPGGRCLIYVWAKEQRRQSVPSTYLKFSTSRDKNIETTKCHKETAHGVILPIHENRTEFVHGDVLVPWKRKDGGNFLRFYHVFQEGELVELCQSIADAKVCDVYYDQGNWCVILEKI